MVQNFGNGIHMKESIRSNPFRKESEAILLTKQCSMIASSSRIIIENLVIIVHDGGHGGLMASVENAKRYRYNNNNMIIYYDRLIVIIVGIMRIESSSFWVSHGLSTNHAAPRAHPRARRRWNFNARQNLLYRTMVPELTRTLPRVNEQRTFEDQSKNQIPSLLLLKEWINRILLHIGKQA